MKKVICIAAALLLAAFLAVWLIPDSSAVNRSLSCTDSVSGEEVEVRAEGTYRAFLLKDDHFVGTIEVVGKMTCTRNFRLVDDSEGWLQDEYGQPYGLVVQSGKFEKVLIADGVFSVSNSPYFQDHYHYSVE